MRWVLAVQGKDRGASYEAVSSMHKEIRRGDAQKAMFWHRLVLEARGETGTKSYLKNILFEETRNLLLEEKWRSTKPSSEEMLIELTMSRKKWELQSMVDVYDIVIRADTDAYDAPPVDADDLRKPPSEDQHEFYSWVLMIARVFHYLRSLSGSRQSILRKRLLGMLADMLASKLRAHDHEQAADIVEAKTDYHQLMLAAETLCGLKDDRSNDIHAARLGDVGADLLMPPVYAYDAHTARGRYLLQRCAVEPGKALPKNVDLRWSGQVSGIWWRYAAFSRFGMDYKRKKWQTIKADEKIWSRVVKSDRIWRGLKV